MPEFALDNVLAGGKRVILGLAQRFILADTIGRLAVPLADPGAYNASMLLLAVYAYAFKIYFDFAGYSDMAIGLAQMLGFKVPENFDRPYFQPNIAQFWRHWHISLSSWIRDYLYIPLGGSRLGFSRTLCNLIVAFAICGLWHGAAWNFVARGLWYGLGMAGHRIWNRYVGGRLAGLGTPVYVLKIFSRLISWLRAGCFSPRPRYPRQVLHTINWPRPACGYLGCKGVSEEWDGFGVICGGYCWM